MTCHRPESALQLLVIVALAARAWAGDAAVAPGLTWSYLRVAASESVVANVNQADAVASMKVWSEQLGKLRGFHLDARVGIAASMSQMRLVFKIGPLVRVSKAQFESVRVLRSRYRWLVEMSSTGAALPGGRPEDALGKGRP